MSWFEHAGSEIYYEQGGKGDPLLFLPGVTESIDEFRSAREALSEQFTVFAADLPGSGKSGPQPREYTASYYQDDASTFLAFIDQLMSAPARIAGFSDGGEVGLLMAENRPDAVRSLAAWGAAAAMALPTEMIDAFAEVIDNPADGFEGFSEHLKLAYGEDSARKTMKSVARAWQAIQDAGGDISRSRADEIVAPVLLITGEHDFIAPPPVVAELAAAIPRGEFVEVKEAGHTVHESHGPWLIETITGWLAKH
jgi:valacyclovir hydrolase